MKILLTGYEPFGGEATNPSWEAVRQLDGENIDGIQIVVAELPVEWDSVEQRLKQIIETHAPDAVICVGQAGGRSTIAIERVGVNRSVGVDNVGIDRTEMVIKEDAPNALFSTLPVVKFNEALNQAGIPSFVSNTAGLYLCNYILYTGLYYLQEKKPTVEMCFIHIPFSPEQVANKPRHMSIPSMDVRLVVDSLRVMIRTYAKEMK